MEGNSGAAAPTIAKAGIPVAGEAVIENQQQSNQNGNEGNEGKDSNPDAGKNDEGKNNGAAGAGADSGKNDAAAGAAADTTPPVLTPEQIKAYGEAMGIPDFDGDFSKLKDKINKPASVELTPEQKAAKEAETERKMLDLYLKNGGKMEEFVAMKAVAAADVKQLSRQQLENELKTEGFDDDEIKAIIAERYYQQDPEALAKGEDEKDEEFAKRKEAVKKKAAYGTKKLESRSTHIVQQAKNHYEQLRKAIEAEDLLEQKEVEFSSKVDGHLQKMPRELTFEMGKSDDQDIAPITLKVPEEIFTEVAAILKDPAKRQTQFFNENNELNLANITELLVRNRLLEAGLKRALLEGGDRQVKVFEQRFPASAQELGIGGNKGAKASGSGKVAKAGQPEYAVQ